jgi:hypothetical protein
MREPRRSDPRLFLAIAGAVILFGVLACTASIASQITSSCACTYPPTHPPGWTPTPPPELSIAQAQKIATDLTGEKMSSYGGWDEFGGQPVLVTRGKDSYAYVHGNTGAVLSAFFVSDLLAESRTGISADDALANAERWLAGVGIPTAGATPTVENKSAAGLPYFAVTRATGSSPTFEVLVNAASGHVFAYRDLRDVRIDVPLIGFSAASALAERSALSHGESASPGDINNLMGGGSSWIWTVGFNDGALSVDAATGEVAVMKWAAQG